MDGTPLPIPFSEIDRYAGRFGPYTPEGFERFVVLIETLDHAFLDRDRQHRKAKSNT